MSSDLTGPRYTSTKYSGSYEGFLEKDAIKKNLETASGIPIEVIVVGREIGANTGRKHTHFTLKFEKKPGRSFKSFDFGDLVAKVKSIRTDRQYDFDIGYTVKDGLQSSDWEGIDREDLEKLRDEYLSTREDGTRSSTIESLVDDQPLRIEEKVIPLNTRFGTAPYGRPFSKNKTMIPISKLNVHVYGPYIWGYNTIKEVEDSVYPLLVGEVDALTKLWNMRPWKQTFSINKLKNVRLFQAWIYALITGNEEMKSLYRNKLTWIADYKGQNGKSWFVDLLDQEIKDMIIIRPGEHKDVAEVVQNHCRSRGIDTVVVDLTRKFKVTNEMFDLLEELCKGKIMIEKWSGKYFKFSDKNPVVLVLWNSHPPDVTVFSPERWFIKIIDQDTKGFFKEMDSTDIFKYLEEDDERQYNTLGMMNFFSKVRSDYRLKFKF